MITLYTNDCPRCHIVKKLLQTKGIVFRTEQIACDPPAHLRNAGIRSMPVLEKDDWMWEGEDCIVAIEEGELCN